jgi:MOSC domain-containing protein YiiM
MPLTVTHLFVKPRHGAALEAVATMDCDTQGIADNVKCAPFRQALIASRSIMAECGLKPGDLRENIVVDFDRLYDLPSGTVVQIGQALLRLTFHCEPCKKILKLVEYDRIVHRRGVFGTFLNIGRIAIGDELVVTERRLEPVPYAVNERIRWYLKNQNGPAAAIDLIHAIGLPSSYARAMPRILEKLMAGRRASERTFTD